MFSLQVLDLPTDSQSNVVSQILINSANSTAITYSTTEISTKTTMTPKQYPVFCVVLSCVTFPNREFRFWQINIPNALIQQKNTNDLLDLKLNGGKKQMQKWLLHQWLSRMSIIIGYKTNKCTGVSSTRSCQHCYLIDSHWLCVQLEMQHFQYR